MHTKYGKLSCGLAVGSVGCLLGVVAAYVYMRTTPATGGGEFRGMNHFAAFCLAAVCFFLSLVFALPGLLAGVAGLRWDRPRGFAAAGAVVNGAVLLTLVTAAAIVLLEAPRGTTG